MYRGVQMRIDRSIAETAPKATLTISNSPLQPINVLYILFLALDFGSP